MIDRPSGYEVQTADYHTAGEPFRIVTAGAAEPQGATVLDKRQWARAHLDDVRALLVNEPRGHADMYGGFPTSGDDEEADLGVVFFHKDGFSTACGHGTIALVTWAISEGVLPLPTPRRRGTPAAATTRTVTVDVPSGRLRTEASLGPGGRVEAVRFWNVPSYVTALGMTAETSVGPIEVDVSYGGAFYASVALDDLGPRGGDLAVEAASLPRLILLAREIKALLRDSPAVAYASDDRLSGLYGVIFSEAAAAAGNHERNVTVFADGEVDRSPCGSGTSARLAVLHRRGLIAVGDPFRNEGIAGGRFTARVEEEIDGAVATSVEGSAFGTGRSTFTLDPRDPLGLGFQLR